MTVLQIHDVPATISAMAAAVQQGKFVEAEQLGQQASYPLSVSKYSMKYGELISEGAQATVHKAMYKPLNGSTPVAVAVKRPRIRESADLERFRGEVGFLAQLQHPGLVTLLGARMMPPDYFVVLGLEASNAATELYDSGWQPGWGAVLLLGAQLAGAVAHMHTHGVIHRDVKPANVLLDSSHTRARLADLGLAASVEAVNAVTQADKPTGGFHKQHMVGTLEYLPPEVLLGGRHSPAADVYALAVTLAELASGITPFSDCTRENPLAHTVLEMGYGRQELAAAVAAEGLRPTLPPTTPESVRKLLECCWDRDPKRRLPAADVAAQLKELSEEFLEGGGGEQQASLSSPSPISSPSSVLPAYVEPQQQQKGEASTEAERQQNAEGAIGGNDFDTDMEECCFSSDDSASEEEAAASSGSRSSGSNGGHSPLHVFPIFGVPSPNSDNGGRWGTTPPAWLRAAHQQQHEQRGEGKGGLAAPAVAGFASAGARGADRMEDRHIIIRDLGGWKGVTVMGVFDGHRGAEAAEYLAANLEKHLGARWHSARSAGELLEGALWDADVAFRAQQDAAWARRVAVVGSGSAGRRQFPGATAAVVLLAGGVVATANLGDSRAVLCRDGMALDLTWDQTADQICERQRILEAGGTVRHVMGGWRVGEAGMQVTRSVGDADLKPEGVTAVAETAELACSPSDTFLVLATDGVWDQLSSRDAVRLVQDTFKNPAMCSQRLVTEALARGSRDNLTAVVAVFPRRDGGGGVPDTLERVYRRLHM